ncbi:MAG: chloride channel protein [Pseudomonadota bacterium]
MRTLLNPLALLRGLARTWEAIRAQGPGEVQFWFIALAVGIASALAAVTFRLGIIWLQSTVYGADDIRVIHSFAATLPWWLVLSVPVLGGLAVGLILHHFTPDARVRSVADVIEGAALKEGRVEKREGLASAAASLITLSTGGSTGREGPVVHLAGVIATWVSDRINASGLTARDLLGCAVAAAVSASFNAPIAGTIFALEVVLRHYAVHAFAPIVIASVAGTVISRSVFGDVAEFDLVDDEMLAFYVELPAFLLLGLLSGLVAITQMRAIFWTDAVGTQLTRRSGLPRWMRPAVAGLLLGAIAIAYPHIIGVGYETTGLALTGQLTFTQAVIFVIVKVAAVAVTMGGRMGGGVFSPSLMIGALTGLAFGHVAVGLFPDVSGNVTLYALAGMGAVAAAVLGAPISTTLILFELTGDWQTGLAVMVAVSTSTAIASRAVHKSFFLTQLENRGIHLAAGPQAYLMSLLTVSGLMRPKDSPRAASEAACRELIEQGVWITRGDTLETAMPIFEREGHAFLPVAHRPPSGAEPDLLGALFQVDALKAYNRALADTAAEEHS